MVVASDPEDDDEGGGGFNSETGTDQGEGQ